MPESDAAAVVSGGDDAAALRRGEGGDRRSAFAQPVREHEPDAVARARIGRLRRKPRAHAAEAVAADQRGLADQEGDRRDLAGRAFVSVEELDLLDRAGLVRIAQVVADEVSVSPDQVEEVAAAGEEEVIRESALRIGLERERRTRRLAAHFTGQEILRALDAQKREARWSSWIGLRGSAQRAHEATIPVLGKVDESDGAVQSRLDGRSEIDVELDESDLVARHALVDLSRRASASRLADLLRELGPLRRFEHFALEPDVGEEDLSVGETECAFPTSSRERARCDRVGDEELLAVDGETRVGPPHVQRPVAVERPRAETAFVDRAVHERGSDSGVRHRRVADCSDARAEEERRHDPDEEHEDPSDRDDRPDPADRDQEFRDALPDPDDGPGFSPARGAGEIARGPRGHPGVFLACRRRRPPGPLLGIGTGSVGGPTGRLRSRRTMQFEGTTSAARRLRPPSRRRCRPPSARPRRSAPGAGSSLP